MTLFYKFRMHIKKRKTVFSRLIYKIAIEIRFLSLPAPNFIFTPILYMHLFVRNTIRQIMIFLYWQPLFVQYLTAKPKYLCLMQGLPYILGNPVIRIGEYCRINGGIIICGRANQTTQPQLIIGNKVFISFNTQFYIGSEIIIGDNCMIAEDCILRGYSGHPIDPDKRKANLPDEDNSVGSIILENNVWLSQGVKINPGVRIGENSVIGTGSIVTKNIPANVIAAGIPAKVIRNLVNS
jgi:acetyltransferase-like isoleucine patch superfamily enzyme